MSIFIEGLPLPISILIDGASLNDLNWNSKKVPTYSTSKSSISLKSFLKSIEWRFGSVGPFFSSFISQNWSTSTNEHQRGIIYSFVSLKSFYWIYTSLNLENLWQNFLLSRRLISSNIKLSNRWWRHQTIAIFDLYVLENGGLSLGKTYFSPKKLSISS